MKKIITLLFMAVPALGQGNLSEGIMFLYPGARSSPPVVDFAVRDSGSGPVVAFWNTNVLGPIPSIQQLLNASTNAAIAAQIEALKVQVEASEKSAVLATNNTKDISYALLKAIQHVTILARWTNFPVTMNTLRTNVPTFSIVRVNYDLAVTGAPVRIAAFGEFNGGFIRIDQQGGSRGTNFYSMTVLLVPDQRWYFTNMTGGGTLTLVNSAMMTLSLQP